MSRAMKDSGVEWIGEIPENWTVKKTKVLFDFGKGLPITKADLQEQGISVISYGQIHSKNNIGTEISDELIRFVDDIYLSTNKTSLVKKGDFIFADTSEDLSGCGNSVYIDKGIELFAGYHTIIFQSRNLVENKYFAYLFLTDSWRSQIRSRVTGVKLFSITKKILKETTIIVPSEKEKRQIVGFLDNKVAEINEIISKSKASIDEYKKYKQAVITGVTTKGLDFSVSMKQLGIEYIDNIPVHWNIANTLFVLEMPITDGPHSTPELYADGVPFVSAEAVSCGNGKIDFNHIRGYISKEFYDECCKKYIPKIDDVYMIKSGATTGRVAIVDTEKIFTIWSPLAVFRCNKERMLPLFLYYSLQSHYYQEQIKLGWTFGTQQNIGMRTLEHLKICIPPLAEQEKIVEYLDNKCSEIDNLIEKKKAFILEMEKYKKSLIYEYVTGKKEVSEQMDYTKWRQQYYDSISDKDLENDIDNYMHEILKKRGLHNDHNDR